MISQASKSLQIGDAELAYTRAGQGPAVIVAHGIGGHKEDWTGLADALAGDHSVYTIDLLGFGGSSKSGEVITIADQVAAIIALLDAEGVAKADMVGNSLGGWVVATLAATHPDQVGRLILVDAAGFKAMFEGESPVNFYPTTLAEMTNLLAHVRFDPATHDDAFASRALAESMATGDAQAAAALFQGMFVSERLEDVANRISVPTLVIWGADDKLFPPGVADLVAGHVRGSRKVLIPNASHFPQLDNPSAFNAAVIEFLQSQPR